MDDEDFLRNMATEMLKLMGYQVLGAAHGDEAIQLTRQAVDAGNPFVAAILDLTIPGGRGGKDTVQALLEIDPNLKVIASSGYSDDPVIANPSVYGFATGLVKPYAMSDLAKVLASLFPATD